MSAIADEEFKAGMKPAIEDLQGALDGANTVIDGFDAFLMPRLVAARDGKTYSEEVGKEHLWLDYWQAAMKRNAEKIDFKQRKITMLWETFARSKQDHRSKQLNWLTFVLIIFVALQALFQFLNYLGGR